jgi:hypothetical protein
MEVKSKLNLFSLIAFIITLVIIASFFPLLKLINTAVNFNPFYMLIWPFLAIVLIVINSLASKQARKMNEKGRGFAITGIVLSSLFALISIIMTLASFAINL